MSYESGYGRHRPVIHFGVEGWDGHVNLLDKRQNSRARFQETLESNGCLGFYVRVKGVEEE